MSEQRIEYFYWVARLEGSKWKQATSRHRSKGDVEAIYSTALVSKQTHDLPGVISIQKQRFVNGESTGEPETVMRSDGGERDAWVASMSFADKGDDPDTERYAVRWEATRREAFGEAFDPRHATIAVEDTLRSILAKYDVCLHASQKTGRSLYTVEVWREGDLEFTTADHDLLAALKAARNNTVISGP